MTKQKNTSLAIGAFIVGAILITFMAIMFISGGQYFSPKKRVMMFFEGSVQGLQVGAPVKLKGVVLGEIIDIQIHLAEGNQPVLTAVSADLVLSKISRNGESMNIEFLKESIDQGMRAQLNFQSLLTGLLYVELDYFPESELKLYNLQDNYLELPTVARGFDEITKNLQEMNIKGLVGNVENLILQLNKVVASGKIEQALGSFDEAAQSINLTSIEFEKLGKNLNETSVELSKLLVTLNEQAPDMAKQLNGNLIVLQKSLDQFNQTANTLNHTFSEDSPLVYQLNTTMQDISKSARAFQSLSETLEQQPEAIWRGKSLSEGDQ